MLTSLLHRAVAHPVVYDAVQIAVGARYVDRRLAARIGPLGGARSVVDIGGGTGIHRGLWAEDCTYVCVDLDPVKLSGYREKYPGGLALQSDASQLAIAGASVDVVLCLFMTHHLPDGVLAGMIAESRRVLRPGGSLVFMDAVWAARRVPGRLLWRYDRGEFPRTAAALRSAIAAHFDVERWERIAVLHEYVLCVATPKAQR